MKLLAVLLFFLLSAPVYAQSVCPANIGFERGNFENWQLLTGLVSSDGAVNVIPGPGYHNVIRENGRNENDYYGKFPVTAPNGSNYSVKLGHDVAGKKADQLIYSFLVPSNADAFSIIFNYAIVLQNPRHREEEQPRFTVKVFNESRSEYIECSSFDFIAGFNQPGFFVSEIADSVLYKPWSSVAINLSTYKGERVRLEFTVNDCTRGGHFGYAYFDVMEKCINTISGNVYCPPTENLTLHAPAGFADYQWFTGNFSQQLGKGSSYTINQPNVGDSFAVELIPFAYFGCRDTFYTKIASGTEPLELLLKDTLIGCSNEGADLTRPDITQGSSASLRFEYFVDSTAMNMVPNPKNVTRSGMYYIRATNASGCIQMKSVAVVVMPQTLFRVVDPPVVSYPEFVNITLLPDNRQLSYTYWENSDLTQPVSNPASISQSGVYYIKGINRYNCASVQPVTVKIQPKVFVPNAFTPNGDGRNDRFLYQVLGGLKELQFFKIYNRWGMEVFSTNKVGASWDGTYKGKKAETGTYVWLLKGSDWLNNAIQTKGTVVIIR